MEPKQPNLFDQAAEPDDHECPFCGGDGSDPDHLLHCCGRQGRVEEEEPPEAPSVTVPSHRSTAIDAFYAGVESGQFETQRLRLYQILLSYVGLAAPTSGEISDTLTPESNFRRNVTARMSELRDLGVAREVGERECRISGKRCVTWAAVLEADYVGEAIVHRCDKCGQPVSRDVPVLTK